MRHETYVRAYMACRIYLHRIPTKHVRGELFVRANGWGSWRAMLLSRARHYTGIDNAPNLCVNAFSDQCAIYGPYGELRLLARSYRHPFSVRVPNSKREADLALRRKCVR